ncbi:MAG: F0F1 ATP synthase subunit B [Candidatus Levyibacteriota bacterium]
MEIINNFGLDPMLLAAQIINFLIILFLLRKLLYKPILGMLKEREVKIKAGLENSEKARLLLEKTLEDEKNILKKAQGQANQMLQEAKNQALELSNKAEKRTKKQTEMLVEEAKNQISREAKLTEEKLTVHVSNLAIQFLQKTMKDFFSEKDQEEIINKAIKRFKEKPN